MMGVPWLFEERGLFFVQKFPNFVNRVDFAPLTPSLHRYDSITSYSIADSFMDNREVSTG